MNTIILIFLFIIIFSALIIIIKYNKLIKLQNRVRSSESDIDIYLNQRFELIPNLIECVKGYTKHESKLLTDVAAQRSAYKKSKNLREASELNNNLNRIIAVAENYPDLKADEQFLNLQYNLTKIENQLQAARRIYNMEVETYNSAIQVIPNNIVAAIFEFKPRDFFQIEEHKKENVKVDGVNM